MADANAQLQWSDDQWNRVRQVVYEEARRARVAGNVLPLYGPLDADATYATKQVLHPQGTLEEVPGYTVDDSETLKLSTLQTKVYLKGAQVADPELNSALIAFRRAANVLARLEDGIVFRGQQGSSQGPPKWWPEGGRDDWSQADEKKFRDPKNLWEATPKRWEVQGGQRTPGLLRAARTHDSIIKVPPGTEPNKNKNGNELVAAVSGAIGKLEANYHLGPFACILDQEYFKTAQTPPDSSLVLPQDRILPFLNGGPLLRSSALPQCTGLVIALGGAPIDLVVATDISVNFLQVTTDPWFVFRVREKVVLRIKERGAVYVLEPK